MKKVTHLCFSDLSVFDTHDGTCVATARCEKAVQSQCGTSCWTRLRSLQIEEVSIKYGCLTLLSEVFHRRLALSWLVPHIELPIPRCLALILLTRLRGSMRVTRCLNSTSETITTSILRGLNHWATGRSMGSPRLPT